MGVQVVPVTGGSGYNIDTRTTSSTAANRQVVVFGDPSVDNNVVSAVTADPGPSSTLPGLVMRLAGSAQVQIAGSTGTIQVYLPDTGHELGSIKGINSSVAVYFDRGNPTVTANAGTGTFTVAFDPGHELGSIKQINSSVAVYFDRAKPIVLADNSSTASIFSVSGSSNAVSTSGATLVSPSANYSFKVFAINITTTAQTFLTVKLTNGSGASPTEYWRYALQAPSQGISGANIAVTPPGHFFATGTNTTLSLVLDSASLVHYSVSYIKESA